MLQASVDLVFASSKVIEGEDDGLIGVNAVLDKWCTYQEGCNLANDYCGSQWARRAKENPTRPYAEALFGCGTQSLPDKQSLTTLLLVLLSGFLVEFRPGPAVVGNPSTANRGPDF